MKSKVIAGIVILIMILRAANMLYAQSTNTDSAWKESYKNIIRYNLSGPIVFGFGNYIIFGYERIVNPRQSFSINVGGVAFPKSAFISIDSFSLDKDTRNKGVNMSFDYRFYLQHENKYNIPHGAYAGPYISYNHFNRTNDWTFQQGSMEQKPVTTTTKFNIFTIGAELGYQFVFWKRLAIDLVLVGPGISVYQLKTKIEGDLTEEQKANLHSAVLQVTTQKFPGMNYVFADEEFDANGVLRTTSFGFRYMIHIGFMF